MHAGAAARLGVRRARLALGAWLGSGFGFGFEVVISVRVRVRVIIRATVRVRVALGAPALPPAALVRAREAQVLGGVRVRGEGEG